MTDVTVCADDVSTVCVVYDVISKAFGSVLGQVPGFGAALEACGRMMAATAAAEGGMPPDPVAGPAEGAILHFDLVRHYQEAGFSREEAFAIVMVQVQAHATASALRGGSG